METHQLLNLWERVRKPNALETHWKRVRNASERVCRAPSPPLFSFYLSLCASSSNPVSFYAGHRLFPSGYVQLYQLERSNPRSSFKGPLPIPLRYVIPDVDGHGFYLSLCGSLAARTLSHSMQATACSLSATLNYTSSSVRTLALPLRAHSRYLCATLSLMFTTAHAVQPS